MSESLICACGVQKYTMLSIRDRKLFFRWRFGKTAQNGSGRSEMGGEPGDKILNLSSLICLVLNNFYLHNCSFT